LIEQENGSLTNRMPVIRLCSSRSRMTRWPYGLLTDNVRNKGRDVAEPETLETLSGS